MLSEDQKQKKAELNRTWRLKNPGRNAELSRAWRLKNLERKTRTTRAWRLKNPDKVKASNNVWLLKHPKSRQENCAKSLKSNYGILLEDFQMMLEAQGHQCAICGGVNLTQRNGKLQRLSVDHDHVTKRVRGLLCLHCNTGLGYFKDNTALLRKALGYLETSQAGLRAVDRLSHLRRKRVK